MTAPGFDATNQETGALLSAAGLEIDLAGPRGDRSAEEVAALVGDAAAAIVSAEPFTRDVFAEAPNLRVLARLGVGVDSIDLEAATDAGVLVTTTPGLNDETCADHAMALLLAVTRRVIEHDASVRRGEWNRGGDLTPWDLHDKRVAVIGYGRIGRAVARRVQAFGTELKVHDPMAAVPDELACASLEEVLPWADIISLHVPLTPATKGMLGAAEFEAMKHGAILISTARGGVVDEGALVAALRGRRLRGAGLDVFAEEPPASNGLRELPNVVLSPHIGGLSRESLHAMARQCVQQVLSALDGEVPEGAINPLAFNGGRG